MKRLMLFSIVFFSATVFAQTDPAVNFASTITGPTLKAHLEIIAGDEFQGRETGTEGQRKAAVYIEKQFRAAGLSMPNGMNGYVQLYPLHKDSMLNSKFSTEGSEAVYGKDYIVSTSNNESGNFKSKSIVFVGYGIVDKTYDDYAGLDVKGKVVAFMLGEPKLDGKYLITGTPKSSEWTFPGISKKLETAFEKGATGVILINPTMVAFNEKFVDNNRKTNLYYPKKEQLNKLNYVLISHEYARNVLGGTTDSLLSHARRQMPYKAEERFEKKTKVSFTFSKERKIIEASNVLGIIEGTDKKDEYVFLTAHYDHLGMHDGKIYYGADDDGSGTVAVIQMAEAFSKAKKAGQGPRRTIVFMTVSGEEKGLWGSEYYSDHPIYPLEKTTVDLNIDMIGRVDTERKTADTLNYIYVVGHDKLSSDLPVINEGMNKKYSGMTLDYKFDDPNDPNRIYFRSDHYNFARKGVPVLFFYDGMLKSDYHKPTDTVDKIYWNLFESRARMIFHTAWEMANRDEMLKRDIPLPESARKR